MKEKPLILVVDDEQINRKILCKMLSINFNVLEARDGKQAWELLTENDGRISAVLLDIMMPVMDGYEFLEKIRQANKKELPIIVMTGESGSESEQKALDAGAWDFVAKPYKPTILLSRLRNAIARSQVAMYEQIQHLSEHDPLTGLHNRSKMYTDTRTLLSQHPETKFAFLKFDIDHFALFNSSFGEHEGDQLLCYMADIVRKEAKHYPICTYGRMNADVFCICIPYENDERICREINQAEMALRNYRGDYLLYNIDFK